MMIVNGRLQEARWLASPNFGTRPQQGDISLVVVHNISLPPGQFGNGYVEQFFTNRLDVTADPYFETIAELKVSSHLFIQRDGSCIQFVNFEDRAWHAGVSEFSGRENCNDYSIGIELEGTDDMPYTEAQYQALTEVTLALLGYYPKINMERITGHENIAPGRKTDPGPAFDWPKYQAMLRSNII